MVLIRATFYVERGFMKKIFIYYSLTGNGDVIAKYLKNKNYDIRKVETSEKLPNNFILRILIGGYKGMINYKDKLIDFDDNVLDYDEIIIGSPIWNSRLSSPINTVLQKLKFDNKKISFILYSGSGKALKAEEFINKTYSNAKVINLIEPKKNNNELKKIKDIYE